jgi:hypothetical protein
MQTANEKTARRWVAMAKAKAKEQMGSSANLLTAEVRHGLEAAALCGIIAGQDESTQNGATMALACELLLGEKS